MVIELSTLTSSRQLRLPFPPELAGSVQDTWCLKPGRQSFFVN
jgi:hypothetical protein